MKAFLMFNDHDFDPKQSLPVNAEDLIQDLELNTLFNAMSLGDNFLFEISRVSVLSSLDDPELIQYRQAILKDCLKNPLVIREIYQIPIEAEILKHKRWLGIFTHSPSAVLSSSVEMMSLFFELLKKLKGIVDENAGTFTSVGFNTLFASIKKELDDEYFSTVDYHLKQLRLRDGVLISAELDKGNEGTNYTLRLPNSRISNWLKEVFSKKYSTYSFSISERDDAGSRALADLKDISLNAVANTMAQATEHLENFIKMLRIELGFYVGCMNLQEQLVQLGHPIAFPIPFLDSERKHSFCDMYDVSLALTMKQKIAGNTINADQKNLVMITGANQGGKSTFLRSIGLAQLMMQAGMFVPAVEFGANVCKGVFTHYRRKEDASMKSGKLDEELSRMSKIVDQIKPNSLMLFNESFAATNEREGSEIARQITSALLEKQVKVYFVTHMYELARICYESRREDILFLRAERKSAGKRTFRLIQGDPLSTSFGVDIYEAVFGIKKAGH